MDKLPVYLRKPIFEKLFQVAEYSKLSKEEREMYDVSLKRKWDAESIRQSAILEKEKARQEGRQEGREEGREEGKQEVVENLLSVGKFTVSEIANFVSVSEDFVEKVRADVESKKK